MVFSENLISTHGVATEQHGVAGNWGTPDNIDEFVPQGRPILCSTLCYTAKITQDLSIYLHIPS